VKPYRHGLTGYDFDAVAHEKELNALGREGWELTAIGDTQNTLWFYFKRPVP
jgi:hypothetical protein